MEVKFSLSALILGWMAILVAGQAASNTSGGNTIGAKGRSGDKKNQLELVLVS